jgi:hypothetical protein
VVGRRAEVAGGVRKALSDIATQSASRSDDAAYTRSIGSLDVSRKDGLSVGLRKRQRER